MLVLAMICSLGACSNQKWIVEANGNTIPIGAYIYNLYVADSKAKSMVENTSESPLKQDIKDEDSSSSSSSSEDTASTESVAEDGTSTETTTDSTSEEASSSENTDETNAMNGEEWIEATALGEVKTMLAVDSMMEEMGVSLTDEELQEAQTQSQSMWAYYAKTLQNLGVSQDSFILASGVYLKKSEKLFTAIYDQGGTQAVSDEEVNNNFLANYVDYEYFSKDFSDTDDSGSTVTLNDDQKNATEAQFQEYANRINEGTSITDIANEYTAAEGLDESPLDTTPQKKDDLSLDSDVKAQFEQMGNNQAIAFRTDDAEYLLYKKDINSDLDQLTKESEIRTDILKEMKEDEYDQMLVDYANTLNIQINFSAMNKYDPKFVEKKVAESSKAASKSSKASSAASGNVSVSDSANVSTNDGGIGGGASS